MIIADDHQIKVLGYRYEDDSPYEIINYNTEQMTLDDDDGNRKDIIELACFVDDCDPRLILVVTW